MQTILKSFLAVGILAGIIFLSSGQTASPPIYAGDDTITLAWGDLGKRLAESGALNAEVMEAIHSARGEFGENERLALNGQTENFVITENNAGFALNMLWALGLANRNRILTEGPMTKYGDAGRFASTGGWSLAIGDPMSHYAAHDLVPLTMAQQIFVERVSKNIYRPCCDNSTYFPDCNHGMAMLGLLELMASQGASETDMYNAALVANSLWFPGEYATIKKYFEAKGINYGNAQEILSAKYSSASGYRKVLEEVKPAEDDGRGCGV